MKEKHIVGSYKDKGFNVKIKLKDQGVLPALAVGLNDFAGTSLYSSEYLVSSYGINNLDMHLGVGWGRLSNKDDGFKILLHIFMIHLTTGRLVMMALVVNLIHLNTFLEIHLHFFMEFRIV